LRDLLLHVRGMYFLEMQSGVKTEEYRDITDYWDIRLTRNDYKRVIILWGYPKLDDKAKRMVFKWKGVRRTTINHPHFGNTPKEVFAIDVSERLE
jgi:hypothetical protein